MGLSEILNFVLGGSLIGAIISILSIRSTLKKVRGEAEQALAAADTVKITNTEHATRILVENIVQPLKEELNETRKELSSLKRVVASLRKAIEGANSCSYHDDCPVLERLRKSPGEGELPSPLDGLVDAGQFLPRHAGRRKRARGDPHGAPDGPAFGDHPSGTDGQPP